MNSKHDVYPVEVFYGTIMEAEIVKSILVDAQIETYINDELSGAMFPWQTAAGGFGAVKLTVSNLDYEAAKLIVDDFERNRNDISL